MTPARRVDLAAGTRYIGATMKLVPIVLVMISGFALAAPKRDVKPATAAQRADYKKHMKAGWALQNKQKWAEAVVEFEAALAAVEADQRAFAELGFSAMNAGDFKKARRADEQAVQVLDEHDQLAAVIAGDYEYHLGRYSFHQATDKLDTRTIGGHRVLWIEVSDALDETSGDETTMTIDTTKNTVVTLCLPGDARTPTRCPLRDVPILREQSGTTTSKTVLDLAIANDGTATVKLKQGPSDDEINAVVGPHKLW